jgi:2-C-methyl-D-erythritol 4-phosphate cytidylyltransferase/2-C-methyl-D-erythritol 2,4-cyclodiphosphate synthase
MEISASNLNISPFHVLIPAAGSGIRMGGDVPKQYQKINGKPILRHTIERFLKFENLESIRVVIDPSHIELYEDSVRGMGIEPYILGGNTRKESVFNGISSFSNLKNEDIILIHDAVRPLFKYQDILELVSAIATDKLAATLAIGITDTLRKGKDNNALDIVDRNNLWVIQTPQGFRYGTILEAHERTVGDNDSYTDDTSLVSAMGIDVAIINGHKQNFKITTPDDMEFASTLMSSNSNKVTISGSGYDVHAFTEGNNIRLCGVDIPHDKSLSGHSDADVALHALTDAILGALAEGDIGEHFPPSDNQWKNVDSSIFVNKAMDLLNYRDGSLTNVDITIICEKPKLSAYKKDMQKKVADICSISPSRVGIKATTTEGLGFTGRGEGIAAQAIVSIEVSE